MTDNTRDYRRLAVSGEARSVRRWLAVVIAVGVGTGSAVVAARHTEGGADRAGAPLTWAALGDSFSSGEGVPPFAERCHRSAAAYAPQAARRLRHGGRTVHLDVRACSGAVVADIYRDQLDSVTRSTNVVTVTIGGNDVGFSEFVVRCVVASCPGLADEGRVVRLGPALASLYREIRARAAPGARVLVLGYPRLAAERRSEASGVLLCGALDTRALDGAIDRVDLEIARSAGAAGVEFVDTRPAFAGKELCSGADPGRWLVNEPGAMSRRYGFAEARRYWFHPNRAGQQAMATLVVDALAGHRSLQSRNP